MLDAEQFFALTVSANINLVENNKYIYGFRMSFMLGKIRQEERGRMEKH